MLVSPKPPTFTAFAVLPEIRLRWDGSEPPMRLPQTQPNFMPVLLGRAFVPVVSVPMKHPSTAIPLAPQPPQQQFPAVTAKSVNLVRQSPRMVQPLNGFRPSPNPGRFSPLSSIIII